MGGIALGGLEALDAFVNHTGRSLMSAFGETGLHRRDQFNIKAYQDRGVVPGYTGDMTRTFADGSVYGRTGSLEIASQGITRIDDVSMTGRGYHDNRNTSIQSRGMNAFANLMQGRYPLAGYDPSDTVITRTSRQTHQRQVVAGGVYSTQSLPLARHHTTLAPGDTSSTDVAAARPHPVGGIYLRGAARALAGFGELTGVAIDEHNGALILLSRQGDIALPPLRLDTVVTVFRAVDTHGVVPWVSIDPDPPDPHGPLMHVVHGPETAGTFVGWVLYEADRVMKGYSLGTDNVTRQRLASQVAGYRHLLHRDFVDGDGRGVQRWERFWLSPAAVKRLQSARLTLFDVPLKVATEVMLMQHGKLVSASDAGRAGGRAVLSSPGAQAFAQWFTGHYDGIERAAILPGAASHDIGGLHLEEVALLVPAPHGGDIALTRTYHSFHTPTTEFGAGWTFDLPRLEEHRRPAQRTGDMTTFTPGYELISPLHTWSALFTHAEMVPELGGTFLVPHTRGAILAVGRRRDEPGPTVFLRHGHHLHFDARGDLLAVDTAPSKRVYRRDASGRLHRLEHWHGGAQLADITLEYDTAGRVTSARGSNGATVR